MNPEEVAGAFSQLKQAGKVRHFGVSNFLPGFVNCLQSALSEPLLVNQVEIHLGRLDCFTDGTLDQCLAQKITPLAWSPLGGGWLGTDGEINADHPRKKHLLALQKAVDDMAAQYGVSRSVMSLAWLLKHPSQIIPIVGSSNPQRIRESIAADALEISRDDWYRLLVAARGEKLP